MIASAEYVRPRRIRVARGTILGVAVGAVTECVYGLIYWINSGWGLAAVASQQASPLPRLLLSAISIGAALFVPAFAGLVMLRLLERRARQLCSGLAARKLAGLSLAAAAAGACGLVMWWLWMPMAGLAGLIGLWLAIETWLAICGESGASGWRWALGVCWTCVGCAAVVLGLCSFVGVDQEALAFLLMPSFTCVAFWVLGAALPIQPQTDMVRDAVATGGTPAADVALDDGDAAAGSYDVRQHGAPSSLDSYVR